VARGETILDSCFRTTGGFMAVGPVDELRGTNAAAMLGLNLGTELPTSENVPIITGDLKSKIRVLESLSQRLDLYDSNTPPPAMPVQGKDIFVVHGHDIASREKVRLFLTKATDRQVLVLEDQPNKGADLLGKLLENAAHAAFAVVILSGDDEGRAVGESELHLRARQNVILELGLFVGLLGRDRVAAFYQKGVEIPSDYGGVLWTELSGEDWTLKLAVELKAAGITVDLNSLI
jgi:predicted nucleotide-binding protein